MTTLNEIVNGPTTVAFGNYTQGTFDCSQPASQGYVNMTLTPDPPDGQNPLQNVSTVLGCYSGLMLTVDAAGGRGAKEAGSGACINYQDVSNPDSGGYTGNTQIIITDPGAMLETGQLNGGFNSTYSHLKYQNQSLTPGQQVAAEWGTYIEFQPGHTGQMLIEANIQALTLIDNLVLNGTNKLTVDCVQGDPAYSITDVEITSTTGNRMFAFVQYTTGTGVLVGNFTAAQLSAHLTVYTIGGNTYLVFV